MLNPTELSSAVLGKNCVSLREIARGGTSAGLRGRMGQICKHHQGPHLQSPPPSPRVPGKPCHVYSRWRSQLTARWSSAGALAPCSPVNVWPWLPSVECRVVPHLQHASTCYTGTSEELRPWESPSRSSTAGFSHFFVDTGWASQEGIIKHLSSGGSQGALQTLSH